MTKAKKPHEQGHPFRLQLFLIGITLFCLTTSQAFGQEVTGCQSTIRPDGSVFFEPMCGGLPCDEYQTQGMLMYWNFGDGEYSFQRSAVKEVTVPNYTGLNQVTLFVSDVYEDADRMSEDPDSPVPIPFPPDEIAPIVITPPHPPMVTRQFSCPVGPLLPKVSPTPTESICVWASNVPKEQGSVKYHVRFYNPTGLSLNRADLKLVKSDGLLLRGISVNYPDEPLDQTDLPFSGVAEQWSTPYTVVTTPPPAPSQHLHVQNFFQDSDVTLELDGEEIFMTCNIAPYRTMSVIVEMVVDEGARNLDPNVSVAVTDLFDNDICRTSDPIKESLDPNFLKIWDGWPLLLPKRKPTECNRTATYQLFIENVGPGPVNQVGINQLLDGSLLDLSTVQVQSVVSAAVPSFEDIACGYPFDDQAPYAEYYHCNNGDNQNLLLDFSRFPLQGTDNPDVSTRQIVVTMSVDIDCPAGNPCNEFYVLKSEATITFDQNAPITTAPAIAYLENGDWMGESLEIFPTHCGANPIGTGTGPVRIIEWVDNDQQVCSQAGPSCACDAGMAYLKIENISDCPLDIVIRSEDSQFPQTLVTTVFRLEPESTTTIDAGELPGGTFGTNTSFESRPSLPE